MKTSSFTSDLEKEKQLASFLDEQYRKNLKHYSFLRENNLTKQHQGIDLVFRNKLTGETFFIDEKAQLDYINESLPTFAFELSYEKRGVRKQGWLFDSHKKTQFYALVTSIYSDAPGVFTLAKITLVNRKLLIENLQDRGVLEHEIGLPEKHGKSTVAQLNPKNEGYLFFSKNNKVERPLNLVLRLDFLLGMGVAKQLV